MLWLIKFAMCTMMPRAGALAGIADTDVDAFLVRLRRESEPRFWLGIALGAVLFTITPLITVGLPVPAFFLSKGQLERHSERILAHPLYLLRQGVFLVRLAAGMCWGADAAVRASFALPAYGPDPGTFRQS